jgi:hypothetical protein
MNDDFTGAKDDLITASLIDSNQITESNLRLIKRFSSGSKSNDKPEKIAE